MPVIALATAAPARVASTATSSTLTSVCTPQQDPQAPGSIPFFIVVELDRSGPPPWTRPVALPSGTVEVLIGGAPNAVVGSQDPDRRWESRGKHIDYEAGVEYQEFTCHAVLTVDHGGASCLVLFADRDMGTHFTYARTSGGYSSIEAGVLLA